MLKPGAPQPQGCGLRTDPRMAPRAMAQEGMFWELVPEDVIEILAELNSADSGREWRGRKDKMERLLGLWAEFECSQRTIQLRE